jgi:hypothetical protein
VQDEGVYEIRVLGLLDARWVKWLGLEDLDTTGESGEVIRLVGRFDQAALHGVLRRLGDLGVVLLSLKRRGDAAPPTRQASGRPGRPGPERC